MYEVKIDATIPLVRREGVEFARVDGRPLPLDAVYPAGEPELPRPAVIQVHGGGWA
jgi:acetyl esterase/lipase